MAIIPNVSLDRLRAGKVSLGFGASHLRTVATPMLAKSAGFDWLFIDMEHGAFSVHEATQLCFASLTAGISPIVRVCFDALDEGTRALDNESERQVQASIDAVLEEGRRSGVVVEYGIAACALENVFLRFTRLQEEADERARASAARGGR